jgi:enoyl-CoA hydratase/carnithine racemase
VRLAVTPGAGGTQRLPRVVGAARARELILTGRVLTAEAALAIGLVTEVVPAGEAVARATVIGKEIAERGPLAVREAKRLIELALDADLATGLAAELDASDRVFASDDMLEGVRSFFDKRGPDYRGR